MDQDKALKINIDNIDLQYTDPQGRPAEKTETYQLIKEKLGDTIVARNLFNN